MLGKNQNRKALVVVAHCDDAVLWMGGAIHHLRWDEDASYFDSSNLYFHSLSPLS